MSSRRQWFADITLARSLRYALLGQCAIAAAVLATDLLGQWPTGGASRRDLPQGPVSPGDQWREYDPATVSPSYVRRDPAPGVETPANMPSRLNFSVMETEDLGSLLLVTGQISEGDAEQFQTYLDSMDEVPAGVALNSPGGVVQEALALGRAIRRMEMDTAVLPGTICLSSCPYLLAGGIARRVSSAASVGMHQHYYNTPGYLPAFLAVEEIQHGQGRTMEYLIEMGVDPGVMVHSLNTPPEEIYVLLDQELSDTRLATEILD
ncbi:hypothetical protein [Tritonibacter scottomollicae]|uniref:COG3904 family protein n=1 Tax=Tritonibacter scottomollicae TaxID=483013 RepID=UPI003AA7F73E